MSGLNETLNRPPAAAPKSLAGEPTDFVSTLMSISKSMRALAGILLHEIDLAVGQDQLLNALDIEKPIAVSVVSEALNVRPSTISKMTERLVGKGLIERGLDKGDARRTVLRLTAEGELKRQEVQAIWKRLEGSLSGSDASIGAAEIADALQTIDTILRRRLARLR